jgi:hypothetical protein
MKPITSTAMPYSLRPIILSLFTAMFPSPIIAATVFTGGFEGDTFTAFAGGRMHGVDFTSTTAQQLTALGFWDSGADGLASSYSIGLWQTSTQTLLASVTISSADTLDTSLTVEGGQWRYENLIAPVMLASGTTYTMGFHLPSSMSESDSLFLIHPTVTTASTVSIIDQRRFLTSGALVFPSSTTSAGILYNAQLNARIVPEPGFAGLVSIGALALLHRRRIAK